MSWLVPSPSPTSRRRRGSGRSRTSRARTTAAVVPVLAALAVCSLVVSCSGDGGAQATATATGSQAASQTASPTPTPTASALESLSAEDQALKDAALAMEKPEPVEGMDEYSVEGASLAAGYFISLYPYVYATGDLTDWQAMSEDNCVFCNNVIHEVTARNEAGGWNDPWEQQVTIISYGDVGDPTVFLIDMNIASGEIVAHGGDGAVVGSRAAQDTELFTLQMHWNGEGWSVAEGAMT